MEVPIWLHPIILCTLVLCSVVYLCQFESSLECTSLGILVCLYILALGVGPEDQHVEKLTCTTLPKSATQLCMSEHHYNICEYHLSSNICASHLKHLSSVPSTSSACLFMTSFITLIYAELYYGILALI